MCERGLMVACWSSWSAGRSLALCVNCYLGVHRHILQESPIWEPESMKQWSIIVLRVEGELLCGASHGDKQAPFSSDKHSPFCTFYFRGLYFPSHVTFSAKNIFKTWLKCRSVSHPVRPHTKQKAPIHSCGVEHSYIHSSLRKKKYTEGKPQRHLSENSIVLYFQNFPLWEQNDSIFFGKKW